MKSNKIDVVTQPKVEQVTIDESGTEEGAPKWIFDDNKNPSDACLKEFVLVGSIPED